MKSHKNPTSTASGAAPDPDVALNPRKIALAKLRRALTLVGGLTAGVAVCVVIALYGHMLFPSTRLAWAQNRGKELRDPVLKPNKPPRSAPEGMVWIPGGEFYMGTDDERFGDAPVHFVSIDGFWMDKTEVTNEQFERFVSATGYLTDAEKFPDRKDFPDVPVDKLKPFSIIFKKPGPNEQVDLRSHTGWWDLQYGASWKHPEGPSSTIKGREQHPVVHINYNDALAYCRWAKKRLPTEAEWEFAARGGLDRKVYEWGDELKPAGKWRCNVWQGNFPYENQREDGFEGTAPSGSFPPNVYGLHEMSGNVWEWCADWYRPDYYRESEERNPQGPITGYDPLEPNTPKRVQRGGSFLCADNYCVRYVVGARGKGEVTSAASHTGFRCAKSEN